MDWNYCRMSVATPFVRFATLIRRPVRSVPPHRQCMIAYAPARDGIVFETAVWLLKITVIGIISCSLDRSDLPTFRTVTLHPDPIGRVGWSISSLAKINFVVRSIRIVFSVPVPSRSVFRGFYRRPGTVTIVFGDRVRFCSRAKRVCVFFQPWVVTCSSPRKTVCRNRRARRPPRRRFLDVRYVREARRRIRASRNRYRWSVAPRPAPKSKKLPICCTLRGSAVSSLKTASRTSPRTYPTRCL